MDINVSFESGELVALLIIGALGGTAAASVFKLDSKGRRVAALVRNTLIGVLGAIVGSVIFRALEIDLPDLLEQSISLADVLVAFVGAVVVIFVAGLLRD